MSSPIDISDLDFEYPEALIATHPQEPCRILLGTPNPKELSWDQLYSLFSPGDLILRNTTKVEKRRLVVVPVGKDANAHPIEMLFLKDLSNNQWEVLFPARGFKPGQVFELVAHPDIKFELKRLGLPQVVSVSVHLTPQMFFDFGHLALPPYIQAARKNQPMDFSKSDSLEMKQDQEWYQTSWATQLGSVASPTASLHFRDEHMREISSRGVLVGDVLLHVGIGTFLPIKVESLDQHIMHEEFYSVPPETQRLIQETKARGNKVWAIGTTVVRAIESWANLKTESRQLENKSLGSDDFGTTRLFIRPGYQFLVVDGLFTNFHQPKSTLLALVMAFSSPEKVHLAYGFAIQQQFRLFSYGDLSVWTR